MTIAPGTALAASAITIALGLAAAAASAAEQERCYGVALAGENDGIDGAEAAGTSTVDYQGNAWVWVDTGNCLTLPLPGQNDGTPRRGALEPLARDAP